MQHFNRPSGNKSLKHDSATVNSPTDAFNMIYSKEIGCVTHTQTKTLLNINNNDCDASKVWTWSHHFHVLSSLISLSFSLLSSLSSSFTFFFNFSFSEFSFLRFFSFVDLFLRNWSFSFIFLAFPDPLLSCHQNSHVRTASEKPFTEDGSSGLIAPYFLILLCEVFALPFWFTV